MLLSDLINSLTNILNEEGELQVMSLTEGRWHETAPETFSVQFFEGGEPFLFVAERTFSVSEWEAIEGLGKLPDDECDECGGLGRTVGFMSGKKEFYDCESCLGYAERVRCECGKLLDSRSGVVYWCEDCSHLYWQVNGKILGPRDVVID